MGFCALKRVPAKKNDFMKAYNINEINEAMKTIPKWSYASTFIERNFIFQDFNEALTFLNRTAELAELHQHHPIFIHNYNKLKIQLNTHDVQGISQKDFDLAQAIDHLLL